ncbi:AMP-binding protein [Actinomadura sp. DC4]|uniref:AMP-binding protein n=1 Tax=Actinomadura sp. DC4 TaxID=3055069 RepID=UPI0025AF8BAE|nr:AMP-binding protein [Actinomadura sp. DC4]MDN3354202.1 AMP-binding protein [Actinomadura sp. DC4]
MPEPPSLVRAAEPTTVPALLRARAEAEPGRVALRLAGGGTLTYGDWDRRSDAVARGVRERGLRPGDPAGLVFGPESHLDFAVAYCGVQKAGGVAVPLGAHLGPHAIAGLLRQCEVAGTVHDGSAPQTPGWSTTTAEAEPALGAEDLLGLGVRPADPAQILYTSGTTGRPKGVTATHANLTYGLDPAPRPRPLAHSEHCLHAFALGSNAAQTMLVNALVARPATVIAPGFDAEEFGALIERHRVGSVFVVPSMAIELVNRRIPQRFDLSSVLLFGSTAAALPPAVALALSEALPGATLTNSYTSTEAAPAQITMVFDPERPGALGRPARPGDIRITGEDGRPVPRECTGAVWLRSYAPPRGYHGQAADGVFAGGWVAMGDLGYQDADGYLHLVDRADDVVKSGALAVSTLRVEAALHEHPAVAEAAVVGVPHPVLGQALAAAVVPAGEIGDLRAFLAERLGRHEMPAHIRSVDALPYNAAGKVVKGELRAVLALGERRNGPAPASATETALARLWGRLLGTAGVGASDEFFALGGDSMRAAQLATLAGEEFGVDVPAALVFDHPDLAGQAAWIDAAGRAARRPADGGSDEHAVGSLQEHLLTWMHELDPPRDVGPMHVAVRVHEEVDPALLAAALDALVRRHDGLRTRFARGPAGWTATVREKPPPELVTRDAVGATEEERQRDAAGLVAAEVARPFDWRRGPLVRAVLVRVGPEEYLAALVIHHLVVDGWSMGILLRELGLLYSALRTGHRPSLPPATQSADVVAWNRRQWPRTRPLWRRALDGAPAAVEYFPGRRLARTYQAASQRFLFEPDLAAGLRAVAERHRTSAFTLVAACWLAVLARHTGASEFVALTPVTGRARPEFESAVGCLAQSLLVRVPVGDDPPLGVLVERVRDGLLAATDRQAYPFAEFGAAVPFPVEIPFSRWPGEPHFPGLISEAFALPHGLVWSWPLPGEDRGVPKLELAELPGGRIEGRLTYNRHAFVEDTVGHLADDLKETVARAVTGAPTPAGSNR